MSTTLPATIGLPVGAAAPKIRPIELFDQVFIHLPTVMGEKGFKFSAKGYPEKREIVFTVKNEKDLNAFLNELAEMDPALHEKFPGLHEVGVYKIGEPRIGNNSGSIKIRLDDDSHILVKVVLKASGFTRSEEAKIEVGAPQGMSVLMGSVSLRNSQQALVLVDEAIRDVIKDPKFNKLLKLNGIEDPDPVDFDPRHLRLLEELHSDLLKQALKSKTRDDGLLKMSLVSVAIGFLEKRLS